MDSKSVFEPKSDCVCYYDFCIGIEFINISTHVGKRENDVCTMPYHHDNDHSDSNNIYSMFGYATTYISVSVFTSTNTKAYTNTRTHRHPMQAHTLWLWLQYA